MVPDPHKPQTVRTHTDLHMRAHKVMTADMHIARSSDDRVLSPSRQIACASYDMPHDHGCRGTDLTPVG